MPDIIVPTSYSAPLPLPSVNVTIRPGVMSDVPFLDSLQKVHTKQVGWMPTKQFEGKIKLGHVLIAEGDELKHEDMKLEATSINGARSEPESCFKFHVSSFKQPLGYCIGNDQYFKRDDVGIIYQLNVLPGKQRGFIGASLLKAQFERSAYGCKLYCCWCAQDIEANHFWEAMGFVPLAYRAGSEKKSRVHIFWQKRIRAGDVTTPWWFPSKTNSGSIREDRIVLPIPPGSHWSDAKPLILPPAELSVVSGQLSVADKKSRSKKSKIVEKPLPIRRNGLMFNIPQQGEPLPELKLKKALKEAKRKPEHVKRTCDPRLVSAARELRDRWLERVNAEPSLLSSSGKYDVAKELSAPAPRQILELPQPIAA